MVSFVFPTNLRAVLLAFFIALATLPITLLFHYFIEVLIFVFCASLLGVSVSRVAITDTGDCIKVAPRIIFFNLKVRVEERGDVRIKERVLNGAGDAGYYDEIVVELVICKEDRPLFTPLEQIIFGSKSLASGVRKLMKLHSEPKG